MFPNNGLLKPRQPITYNVGERRIPLAADIPDSGEIRAALEEVSARTGITTSEKKLWF